LSIKSGWVNHETHERHEKLFRIALRSCVTCFAVKIPANRLRPRFLHLRCPPAKLRRPAIELHARPTTCDGQPATKAGSTSGLEDVAHKAAVALHVLNTVVKNTYKNNPARLAEWTTASHVEKHTPVPRAKPSAAPAQK